MTSASSAVAFMGGSLSQPQFGSHLGTARPAPVAAVLEQEAAHEQELGQELEGLLQRVAKERMSRAKDRVVHVERLGHHLAQERAVQRQRGRIEYLPPDEPDGEMAAIPDHAEDEQRRERERDRDPVV